MNTSPPPAVPAGQAPGAALVSLEHVSVEFSTRAGTVHAVDDVTLDIAPGETLAVLGESGCGKSVTALSIMGLVPRPAGKVTAGRIVFEGEDITHATGNELRSVRGKRIGMIFQDPLSSLNPVHTVGAQIDEMFRQHEHASRRRARAQTVELMERVRIPDPVHRAESYPHEFSGGMRQRIMIAMAIALRPRLLIADEPTTALDVTVQAQIIDLLRELRDDEGMALLFITHDLGVVAPLADRVAVMYGGRIVESGPTREVYEHPSHPYTAGLLASLPDLGARRRRLLPIPGSPPNLLEAPAGCAFVPRCRFARELCRVTRPELRAVTEAHESACLRADAVADEMRKQAHGIPA